MMTGKITAKLRDAVMVCLMVEGKEIKRHKNIELPDSIKDVELLDFHFNVPMDGKINNYTLSHINLLQYFSVDPFHLENTVKKNGMVTTMTFGGTEYPMTGIVESLPEFKNDTVFVKRIAGQLITDSPISVIDFETSVSKKRARCKRITPYGKAFLNFIKEDNEG